MRIATLTAAALLVTAPAVAQRATDAPKKKCKPVPGLVEYKPGQAIGPQKLGDLPPAVEMKALWHVVDGCPQPIVMRRGVGEPNGK